MTTESMYVTGTRRIGNTSSEISFGPFFNTQLAQECLVALSSRPDVEQGKIVDAQNKEYVPTDGDGKK